MTRIHTSTRQTRLSALAERFRQVRRDERGFSFVFVGLGFMAFFAATALAVDVGMLMTARTQAQASADAGALAGATALAFDSLTNHSATGPAVTSAISTATANLVAGEAPSVTVPDVTFLHNPDTDRDDIIQVWSYRTAARQNPVPTLIARIYGVSTADIAAVARAAALPADAERCVLPMTIPDKWIENQTGPWDPTDSYNKHAEQGNKQVGPPLSNPDIYIPPGQPGATGYNPVTDKGTQLVLKSSNNTKVAPSMYSPWDLPGSVGGDDYSQNIAGCNPNLVRMGDDMTPENGNMVGPTSEGVSDLKALDPNAHWDTGCNCVKGSAFLTSPRIRVVPLYDPSFFADGQQTGKSGPQLKVVNYLGFFIEDVTGGGDVTGRITPISGLLTSSGAVPTGGFATAIRLVQ